MIFLSLSENELSINQLILGDACCVGGRGEEFLGREDKYDEIKTTKVIYIYSLYSIYLVPGGMVVFPSTRTMIKFSIASGIIACRHRSSQKQNKER